MNRLAILPAALVPGAIYALQRSHAPDGASGLIVGMLLGLSLIAFVRRKGCSPLR